MTNSYEKIAAGLNLCESRKYYVYRLIDPRTYQTFYVGKGCGERALQHVKEAKSLISKDEDATSLKTQQIAEIIAAGKEVIIVIHRRGLTEREAFEVEAALIDCYPNLSNIQKGHGNERGCITLEDLYLSLNTEVYQEPYEKYIIIKTTPEAINTDGGLYEATRKAWKANLDRAKRYKYVLSVVYGIVREVYEAEEWFRIDDRIGFHGKPTTALLSLKGKRIPDKYRLKGNAAPFLYKK